MEKNTKIPVHIVNGNAFIWDPEGFYLNSIKKLNWKFHFHEYILLKNV